MSPDLAAALREQTPSAPADLRERIRLITAARPAPRRRLTVRRALLWGTPAAAIGSLAVAVVVGVITAAAPRAPEPVGLENQPSGEPALPYELRLGADARTAVTPQLPAQLRAALPPNPSRGRAQEVHADFRILVGDANDLSAASQRALRTTRRLGGYVVTVDYGMPEPSEGTASFRVRIPRSRLQAAIVQFSGLGRILSQQTQITDLQQRLDELTRAIRRTKEETRIAALRRERTQLTRRAAYATVDLGLTTREPEAQSAPPSRFDRAVDDAMGVLAAEVAVGAYVLIVASPFLVLLAAAFAGSRAYRRYADQRLLERA